MESAPVNKALAYLGLSTIVGLFVTGFYQLAVGFLVAKMGTRTMGTISIVYPLIPIIPGTGLLFGNSGAAYMAEPLGVGEKEKAETMSVSTAFYCILLSIMTRLLLLVILVLLVHMGALSGVLPFAV